MMIGGEEWSHGETDPLDMVEEEWMLEVVVVSWGRDVVKGPQVVKEETMRNGPRCGDGIYPMLDMMEKSGMMEVAEAG